MRDGGEPAGGNPVCAVLVVLNRLECEAYGFGKSRLAKAELPPSKPHSLADKLVCRRGPF